MALLLVGVTPATLVDLMASHEFETRQQMRQDHLRQAFVGELQSSLSVFAAAVAVVPRSAGGDVAAAKPLRDPQRAIQLLGEVLGATWGLHSVQLRHVANPSETLAIWSAPGLPGDAGGPVGAGLSGSGSIDGIRCTPVCVQRIRLPFGDDGLVAVFERSVEHALQRFLQHTGAGVALIDSAFHAPGGDGSPVLLQGAARLPVIASALHGFADAAGPDATRVRRFEHAGRWYAVDELQLPVLPATLRVFLVDDISDLAAARSALRARHFAIAATMVVACTMLLLAIAWVPLRRWRALLSVLPQLALLPPANLRERFPGRSGDVSRASRSDVLTQLVPAIADRIFTADQTLHLTRRALKQTRRNLQFVQNMARVVSWSGEPISGAFVFGQGASEISPVLAHVCSWTEFLAFVHPEDRLKMLRAWRAGAPGGRLDIAFRLQIDQQNIDLHAIAQFEAAGPMRTLRAFGMMQDVSEMRSVQRLLAEHADRLEDEIAERTRELSAERDRAQARADKKSRFAASVSHEIRTPMNAVLGLAQLGVRDGGDPVSVARFRDILEAGDHLVKVVNDVLDLSKLEAGQVKIATEAFDIEPVALQALDMVRPQANAKGLQLSLHMADAISTPVRGDPFRLRQILINLLANAVRFTEVGRVSIEIVRDGERGCFHVRDTGVGMSPAVLQRLFSPFYQVQSECAAPFAGTGLGLAISDELARAMRGEIQVFSLPGEGSEFVLRLPLPEVVSVVQDTVPSRDMVGATRLLAGIHVLVVDDVAINRKVTAHLLRVDGATVESVADGAMAVKRVLDRKAKPIDIVLMDVQMPGIDGRAATRQLRQAGCLVPVIGCTADSSSAGFEASLNAGMQDQLIKPLMREMFIERVLVQVRRTAMDEVRDADVQPVYRLNCPSAQNTL